MTAPTQTGIASEWTPAASSTRPAHAATTTLLTTATIPRDQVAGQGSEVDAGATVGFRDGDRAGGLQVEVLGGRERRRGS
jgi:hypothetical protein